MFIYKGFLLLVVSSKSVCINTTGLSEESTERGSSFASGQMNCFGLREVA